MSLAQDARALRGARGFWRLLAVRLLGQAADGALQSGLATLFFFSPERASTPGGVAIAFAVMLGPFTLVGPWAGVLLDLWSRRAVLVWANLARAAMAGGIAALMATSGVTPAVYVLSLFALAVNRLVLAAIPAAQPRVVSPDVLITANSLAPTLGTVAAGLGALVGLAVAALSGQDNRWITIVLAAAGFALSALVSARFAAQTLGPDTVARRARDAFAELARGLAHGAREVWHARKVALALGAMAVSRLAYGLVFIAAILMSRNVFADQAVHPADDGAVGLGPFSLILGFAAAGFALAALVTPLVKERIRPEAWVGWCLAAAALAQGVVAASTSLAVLLPAAMLLSAGVQGVKIATDTIVQRDLPDSVRGRAFALYDMLYNIAFICAAALGAGLLPFSGHSPALLGALAGAYLVVAAASARAFRSS